MILFWNRILILDDKLFNPDESWKLVSEESKRYVEFENENFFVSKQNLISETIYREFLFLNETFQNQLSSIAKPVSSFVRAHSLEIFIHDYSQTSKSF